MATKFYVDRNRPENGVLDDWNKCEELKKQGGTNFVSKDENGNAFTSREEAEEYCERLRNGDSITNQNTSEKNGKTKAVSSEMSQSAVLPNGDKIIMKKFEPDMSIDYYEVHSDGGVKDNGSGGAGGYGYVVLDKQHHIVAEGFGSRMHSTNNQMELQGAIEGLKCVPVGAKVYFLTDSTYVYAGFANDEFTNYQPRYEKWENKNWKDVKNLEQVKELYELGKSHSLECIPRNIVISAGKTPSYEKMAHGGKTKTSDGLYKNPYNKICDRLANIGKADGFNGVEHDVKLIENAQIVGEREQDRTVAKSGDKIEFFDQYAPFTVSELNEDGYGKVIDADGKIAKVN